MDYFPLDLKNKGCKSTKNNEPFLWLDNRIRCRQLSGMHQPPYELLFVHLDDIHCISASWRREDGSKEPCLGWYKWSKKYEKRTIDWGSPIAHWTSHQDLSALHLRKNVNSFIFIRFFYIWKPMPWSKILLSRRNSLESFQKGISLKKWNETSIFPGSNSWW